MEILHWDPSQIGDLTPFYNEQYAADLPFCFPVSPEEFAEGLHCAPTAKEDFLHEQLFVGVEDGAIAGYIHVGVWKDPHASFRKGGDAIGLVRFFHFTPDHRSVGQALLQQAEAYFQAADQRHFILGVYGYTFNQFSVYGFVDTHMHVPALLKANGYDKYSTWLYMLLRDYRIQAPIAPDDEVKLQARHEDGQGLLPNFYANLTRADVEIGEWESQSCGDYCRAPEAQESFYIDGIEIAEEERGKGLGAFLLKNALYEMQNLGYKNAMLHVTAHTAIAQLLYTTMGFRVENTLYEFHREIIE